MTETDFEKWLDNKDNWLYVVEWFDDGSKQIAKDGGALNDDDVPEIYLGLKELKDAGFHVVSNDELYKFVIGYRRAVIDEVYFKKYFQEWKSKRGAGK